MKDKNIARYRYKIHYLEESQVEPDSDLLNSIPFLPLISRFYEYN